MADRWEVYREKISEAFAKLADTTQRFTKIGKIRMDILSLKKEIEHQQVLLGQRVYQLVKEDQADQLATDDVIRDHVSKIDELKEKVAAKEAEIEELRRAKEEKPSEAPAEPETSVQTAEETPPAQEGQPGEPTAKASDEPETAESKPKSRGKSQKKKSDDDSTGSNEKQEG